MVQRSLAGALAAGVLAALLAGTGGAAAQTAVGAAAADAGELGLSVRAGFGADGLAAHDTWMPVEVTLAPSRLFAGEIALVSSGASVERLAVEVPAGSRKVFRFLAPPGHPLSVRVTPDGARPLERRVQRRDPGGAFLVGVLGDLPAGAAPAVAAYPTQRRGALVALDPAWLERSPRALDGLGTLLAPWTLLAGLPEEARGNLAAAVAGGLHLTVVADVPGPLDLSALGLPWSPAAAAAPATVALSGDEPANGPASGPPASATAATAATAGVLAITPADGAWTLVAGDLPGAARGDRTPLAAALPAGRGRVAVTGVVPGDGPLGASAHLWGHLVQPRLPGGSGPWRAHDTAATALGGGLAPPALPWLTGFLIAYVLVVGPVNAVVLGRVGRRELAWVTVPAVTVAFAAGALVAASRSAPPVGLAGRVAWWVDGVGSELVATAVRAPTPGRHTVVYPGGGWDVLTSGTQAGGAVERGASDTHVALDLEALQVGTVLGWRRLAGAPPLAVRATVTADEVAVEVTNTGSVELADLEVRAGTATVHAGRLAPGEATTATIPAGEPLPLVRDWDHDIWHHRGPQGRPEPPQALRFLLSYDVLAGDPGLVWVTGTAVPAGDLPRADGAAAQDQGALLAVGVTPAVPGPALPPHAVHRSLVPGDGGMHRPGPLVVEATGEPVLLRFRLPRAGRVAELVSTLDRGMVDGHHPGRPPEVCEEVPVRDPQGREQGVEVICRAPPEMPPPLAAPPCPPEAVSCEFTGDSWTFCFADGRCEGGGVARPEPAGGLLLEVFDRGSGAWVPVAEALRAGDHERLVSPLGEVYVRLGGPGHVIDYASRGLAARLDAEAA